jgi:hypothetical protein
MPTSSSFRPCRSSRLRRLPPRDPRRSVAPCTRSWGSVRFGSTTLNTPCGAPNHVFLPRNRVSHPPEPVPSSAAVPRHRGPCPRVVSRLPRTEVRGAVSTSRLCSTDESGIGSRRCRRDRPVALLGFVPLQGPPRILCVSESRRTGDPTFLELWRSRLAPTSCSAKALRGIRWRYSCPTPEREVQARTVRVNRGACAGSSRAGKVRLRRPAETDLRGLPDCRPVGPDVTGLPTLMGFLTSKTDRQQPPGSLGRRPGGWLASSVRSGIPCRVSSGVSESSAAAFPRWLRPPLWSWWGLQGRWRRRHYRGSGSTVSPSALGLRVVGLPRTPPMILT